MGVCMRIFQWGILLFFPGPRANFDASLELHWSSFIPFPRLSAGQHSFSFHLDLEIIRLDGPVHPCGSFSGSLPRPQRAESIMNLEYARVCLSLSYHAYNSARFLCCCCPHCFSLHLSRCCVRSNKFHKFPNQQQSYPFT